jgi:hypothetical protein
MNRIKKINKYFFFKKKTIKKNYDNKKYYIINIIHINIYKYNILYKKNIFLLFYMI